MKQYLLGVINMETNKYEHILHVEKPNKYKCIGCGDELILRKGEKLFQNFVHKNLVSCGYFKTPTQDQLISDAKMFLQRLIETNLVTIYKQCSICKFKNRVDLPVFDETKSISMNYGKGKNFMDLVYLDSNNNIICGFEVYDGEPKKIRKTQYPYYQINMLELIYRITRSFATNKIELNCNFKIICASCEQYV